MLRILPQMRTTPSSAKPWVNTPRLLRHFSRLSATSDHKTVVKPPPCGGAHEAIDIMMKVSAFASIVQCASIVIIQLQIVLWTCHSSSLQEFERYWNLSMLDLGLLTVKYGRAYATVSYRIAIFCAVSYHIHFLPHGHIMQSLLIRSTSKLWKST